MNVTVDGTFGEGPHHCEGGNLVHWSVSGYGQYGYGCTMCNMFVTAPNAYRGDTTMFAVCPLDEVIMPTVYRQVPAYRRMVGLTP